MAHEKLLYKEYGRWLIKMAVSYHETRIIQNGKILARHSVFKIQNSDAIYRCFITHVSNDSNSPTADFDNSGSFIFSL